MTTEWRDLPTLADVAAAQAAGEEIQVKTYDEWEHWSGFYWSTMYTFRSRQRAAAEIGRTK